MLKNVKLSTIEKNSSIILFDGVCNLCNSAVKVVVKNDPKKHFKMGSLQSKSAQLLMAKFQYTGNDFSSFILISNEQIYTKSTAALKVVQKLNTFWKLLYVFIIVPKPIRDFVYTYIAKNRYKWFGKKEQCWIPNKNIRDRFID